MNVPNVARVLLYAYRERVYCLLELLLIAVREPYVIVNVGLVRVKRLVLQRLFERLYALFVLFEGVVGEAQPVEDLGVALVDLEARSQVLDALGEEAEVVVALGAVN